MSRLLIVGGSDAGIMAALRARELDPSAKVTMMLADRYPNFSICGLPFYVSGEVEDWRALAHRTAQDIAGHGVDVRLEHVVLRLEPGAKVAHVRDDAGRERMEPYDVAIIATGARPRTASIKRMDVPGVYPLHTMEDSFRVRDRLAAGDATRALIVGAGYIGLEMADAFAQRGLQVILVGRSPTVMPTVDLPLGDLVRTELERHGVEVATGVTVTEILQHGRALEVCGEAGFSRQVDLVLVGGGVEPNSDLARAAGVATGIQNAIRVDRRMRTNVPDVLAAGDCVETWHRVLERATYLPLKVFELAVARTGLRDDEAREAGFEPLTIESTPWHHKAYYPAAHRLHIRVTGDRRTGRLLGAQIVGHWQAEVSKRIDIFASALFHSMSVDGINDLDLSYTPPMGAPWDAVQEAAQVWLRAAAAAGR